MNTAVLVPVAVDVMTNELGAVAESQGISVTYLVESGTPVSPVTPLRVSVPAQFGLGWGYDEFGGTKKDGREEEVPWREE